VHSYGMDGWNNAWMWIFGAVLLVVVVGLIRRKNR